MLFTADNRRCCEVMASLPSDSAYPIRSDAVIERIGLATWARNFAIPVVYERRVFLGRPDSHIDMSWSSWVAPDMSALNGTTLAGGALIRGIVFIFDLRYFLHSVRAPDTATSAIP